MRFMPLFVLAGLLSACGGAGNQGSSFRLTENSMYNIDSVHAAATGTTTKDKNAEKEFLEALDLYRNKKKAGQSIPLFKSSILKQPQAKAYYELGNALLDGGKYKEAIQSFDMAEQLNYTPLHKLLYNKACAYSLDNNEEKGMYYLVSAIEFGYTNLDNIMKDKDLANLRKNSYRFTTSVKEALSGHGDPEKLQWTMYYRGFKQVNFPLTLDKSYATKQEFKDIPYDFEKYVSEMRNAKFERETGSAFYYVGLIKSDSTFRTVCYAVNDKEIEGYNWPYYFLASYAPSGKLIDKLMIAGQQLDEDPYKVGVVNANGEITVTAYKMEYEKDVTKTPFNENKEKSSTEIKKDFYSISADGHFVHKANEPLALR
ncbi:MAG: hypothetical protein JO154_18465 [Chitinophaga sp.]|uniref:tetratricopeptide repeat protein n=1 Tax=Chitinophaga sp. TaxID=1869181 RepID=UPI0025C47AA8|nr:hypothetical protein [Chitinophaga sp.]MBV8254592.1 hypothetical protein [Chitinophaga sp.]